MALSFATAADAIKYETAGMALGLLGGAAVEFVGTEVVKALDIPQERSPSALAAEFVIRGAISAIGYLVFERMAGAVNTSRNDPTGGAYFAYAYGISQRSLFDVTRRLSSLLSSGALFSSAATAPRPKPCCSDCAHGKPCAGK